MHISSLTAVWCCLLALVAIQPIFSAVIYPSRSLHSIARSVTGPLQMRDDAQDTSSEDGSQGASSGSSSSSSSSSSTSGSGASRAVFVEFTLTLVRNDAQGLEHTLEGMDSGDVRDVIWHAAITIQGDGVANGNLRTEIDLLGAGPDGSAAGTYLRQLDYTVRVRDYGLGNSMAAPVSRFAGGGFQDPMDKYIKVFPIGTTTVQNKDMLDNTGKGLVADVWSPNTQYAPSGNNCIRLVGNIASKMGITMPADLQPIFQDTNNYLLMERRYGRLLQANSPIQLEQYPASGNKLDAAKWIWTYEDPQNPKLIGTTGTESTSSYSGSNQYVQNSDGSNTEITADEGLFEATNHPNPAEMYLQGSPGVSDPYASDSQYALNSIGSALSSDDVGLPSSKQLATSGTAALSLIRVGGIINSVISAATHSLTVIGAAAAAIGIAYIIIDIVNGDYVGAAIEAAGVASVVAGIALDCFIGGPVGAIVGLVAGILLAVLPGLFTSKKNNPPTNNPAQIIQYSFFGDKTLTGNENCNAQRKQQGLNQNCTAVYGPGVLSKVFGWDFFDATIFLINYNDGHSMSILEIAAAFQVKDYTQSDWGTNVTAVIDCGPAPVQQLTPVPVVNGRSLLIEEMSHPELDDPELGRRSSSTSTTNSGPSTGYDCSKPKYSIKRNLITLPALNSSTADLIYPRIIPAPNGDCKILSDPVSGVNIPIIDLTITGRPATIACGITPDSVEGVGGTTNLTTVTSSDKNQTTYTSGIVTLYDPATNTTNHVSFNQTTNGNSTTFQTNATSQVNTYSNVTSTDQSSDPSRAYVAPPPPSAFAPYNALNSVCISSSGGSVCLPNGTYGIPTGGYGFSVKGANGITFPPNENPPATLSFPLNAYEASNNPDESPYAAQATSTVSFSSNVSTSATSDFAQKMNLLANSGNSNPINIFVPNSPPGVCLYSQAKFQGDVACFGVGGTNLTGSVVDKSSSLSLVGNSTSVWVYGDYYGDTGGVHFTTSVADLSQSPYGSDNSFKNQIKAMWIETET